jgi:Xaa-Pro aminopeptidase
MPSATAGVDLDRLLAYRRRRVVEQMEAHDLDGIVALKFENARYITGLRPLWFPYVQLRNAAVINRSGEMLCYVTGGDWRHRQETMTWLDPSQVRNLPPLEDRVLARKTIPLLADALRELGAGRGRIGLDVAYLYLLEELKANLPDCEWVDADGPLRTARVVKNEDELALFRNACDAVDEGLAAAIDAVAPGVKECEVLGAGVNAMYGRGMEIVQCSSIVASGDHLSPLARFASERRIEDGELVFIDLGGCFDGMFAEATRTVVCGTPNDEQRRIYQTVQRTLEAVIDALGPGAPGTAAQDAMDATFKAAGYGDHALETVLGHSIGVAGWEPPTLGTPAVTGEEVVMEPGMVFSLEPTLIVPGVPGGGGVRLEDEIVITQERAESWTRAPLDDRLMAPLD